MSISVFADELARLIPDPDNSEGAEQGVSSHYNFLTVYHCERNANTIRIISARKSDKLERNSMRATVMRESYDFSKSVKNPYAKRLKKQVTIRIDEDTISYFKEMADTKGIPYQSLINLYLRDCASEHRQLETKWG